MAMDNTDSSPTPMDETSRPVRGPDGLYHDLDKFAGTWIDDPEFDRAMEEFDRIDEELWS